MKLKTKKNYLKKNVKKNSRHEIRDWDKPIKNKSQAQNLVTPYKRKWKKSQCSKPNNS